MLGLWVAMRKSVVHLPTKAAVLSPCSSTMGMFCRAGPPISKTGVWQAGTVQQQPSSDQQGSSEGCTSDQQSGTQPASSPSGTQAGVAVPADGDSSPVDGRPSATGLLGLVVATCCHHRCTWQVSFWHASVLAPVSGSEHTTDLLSTSPIQMSEASDCPVLWYMHHGCKARLMPLAQTLRPSLGCAGLCGN